MLRWHSFVLEWQKIGSKRPEVSCMLLTFSSGHESQSCQSFSTHPKDETEGFAVATLLHGCRRRRRAMPAGCRLASERERRYNETTRAAAMVSSAIFSASVGLSPSLHRPSARAPRVRVGRIAYAKVTRNVPYSIVNFALLLFPWRRASFLRPFPTLIGEFCFRYFPFAALRFIIFEFVF